MALRPHPQPRSNSCKLPPPSSASRWRNTRLFQRSERAAKVMPKQRALSLSLPQSNPLGEGGAIYLKCAMCLSAVPGSPVDGSTATGGRIGAYCYPRLQSMPLPRVSDCSSRPSSGVFCPIFENWNENSLLFPFFLKIIGQKEISVNLLTAIDFFFVLPYNEA